MEQISAIILAGGQGSRMQSQDKGWVLYKDKPLIQHVIKRIQSQVNTILISANRNIEKYQALGYSVIQDKITGFKGPLIGIYSAMQYYSSDYYAIIPCDSPYLPLDLIKKLYIKNKITVAYDGKRLQNLFMLIPDGYQDNLYNFLQQKHYKVKTWLEENHYQPIDFSEQPQAFTNFNTIDDLCK